MSARRCQFCGRIIYGRSDKRYCTSTCRRDASRARHRVIHLGTFVVEGSEWLRSGIPERLIPRLEREHGASHRSIHEARRRAKAIREQEMEELAEAMRQRTDKP